MTDDGAPAAAGHPRAGGIGGTSPYKPTTPLFGPYVGVLENPVFPEVHSFAKPPAPRAWGGGDAGTHVAAGCRLSLDAAAQAGGQPAAGGGGHPGILAIWSTHTWRHGSARTQVPTGHIHPTGPKWPKGPNCCWSPTAPRAARAGMFAHLSCSGQGGSDSTKVCYGGRCVVECVAVTPVGVENAPGAG